MKKLASFWMIIFRAVAVSLVLSSCTTGITQKSPAAGQDPPTASPYASANAVEPPPASPYSGGDTAQRYPPATARAAANSGQSVQPAMSVSADYRIVPQDILQILVFQVPDLNNSVQVSQDGTVTLPLVGKVQLSGRTTYEAEKILTARYRRYLQSPQVSVSLKTYGSRITISGQVKNPRVLVDDGNTTLSEAIANAGGVSDLANASRIHVARSINGHVQDEVYNLDDIQAGKTKDPLLRGGDIVVTESSGAKVALKHVQDLLPFAVLGALI